MLIVIAEKEELKLVEKLGYSNCPVLITGVGALNVIDALKDLPKDTEILNIGYAGSNHWEVGTIVEVVKVATNHEIAHFCEPFKFLQYKNEYDDTAYCYTSTDFVENTNKTEHCVFDMELAFIRAIMPNTRAIKVVSDNLSHKQYKNKTKGEL